ncbi:chromate transporter [Janthinobacterium lividum]|uniref:Chromate transporter n=1 Tax=Janthinobacterium lividum TaxID=29581 RepID=A0AAJ4T405_9BURK|nr:MULTISPECIES: chromate transporter [Janthinobacterium]KAB0325867.1 chromate transporter [Janthinobacterium lividum]MBR7635349.1 chromate transporter [Janthinobacterium lividum]MCC7696558.1 chromate transporter [Janthinobacterium sp. EB271-G4-7A]MCC7711998.1 chromate transporter [Janthinobacterium lividum]MDO8034116.1 chromate transporter [Janthinobacterium sp. SUN128]
MPSPSSIQPDLPRPQPASLADLFFSFTWLALQGFGGVLAVIQREMVERKRWLTQEEFLEDWAVAQIMPGPNVVNLSLMVGGRYFGLKGALTALAGMLAVPLLIVLVLGVLYTRFGDNAQMAGALRGMAAVSAGMIAATGVKLAAALGKHPLPLWLTLSITVLGVLMVAIFRWPLLYILLGLGGIGCLLTYRKLSA